MLKHMSKQMLRRTLLSSAMVLGLSFQGVQDASAYAYSQTTAGFDSFSYSSGDGVELDLTLINYLAGSEVNGIPGSTTFSPNLVDSEAYDYTADDELLAISYASADVDYLEFANEAYAWGESFGDDSVPGAASSEAWIELQFTAIGTGMVNFLGPVYYEFQAEADAGECAGFSTLSEMTISVGGEVDQAVANDGVQCGHALGFTSADSNLQLSMALEDGETGTIRLYSSAAISFFSEAVALPLPASLGMLLLGLLMVGLSRRKLTPSV